MFLMRDETRKEERSKQDQTNNKAKQHSTPKAVTFPKKNELPQVGLEPTTLYYMYTCMYMLMRDEEGRKKEASKVIHVQKNKAKQHSTPKTITFPNKNELHVHVRVQWVGFNPMTLQSAL